MALGKIVKRATGVRKGRINHVTKNNRMKGRYCVIIEVEKAPKSAVKGVKLKPIQFHGCFTKKADAVARLEKLVNQKNQPKRRGRR